MSDVRDLVAEAPISSTNGKELSLKDHELVPFNGQDFELNAQLKSEARLLPSSSAEDAKKNTALSYLPSITFHGAAELTLTRARGGSEVVSSSSQLRDESKLPERAPERADKTTEKDDKKSERLHVHVPDEMKFGAAWNAWDRIDAKTATDLARSIRFASDNLRQRADAIKNPEKTDTGALMKKDSHGRVVAIEDASRNLKLYFNYEGSSTAVTEMVVENTKTKECRSMVALYRPASESPSGKQEWLGIGSSGKATHMSGEVTVGDAGGYKINLKSRSDSRDLLPAAEKIAVGKKSELAEQSEKLQKIAERYITKPVEREQFAKDMAKFQQVAKMRGLPDSEVTDFFKESAKLMSTESRFVNQRDRIRLVQQALKQAIEPTSIRQGNYNTCNVASIEVCMYSRNPSKAIKAVSEAALTGSFNTADGKKIELNASTFKEKGYARSFASQIFQDLAVNSHWRTAAVGPDGEKTFKPGEFRYDHDGPKSKPTDGSQRLTGVVIESGKTVELGRSPKISGSLFPEIYRKIAGTKPDTLVLERGATESTVSGFERLKTQEKLHETLSELSKKPGGLPVILVVHTSNEPFWKDSGAGAAGGAGLKIEDAKKEKKPPGGWHVVTVHGYDPITKKAAVDNTWDPGSDHLGKPGQGAEISVDQLFKSMGRHPERLKELGWEPPVPAPKPVPSKKR